MAIAIECVEGDVFAFRADVLALKYAQATYGVDERVVMELAAAGTDVSGRLPKIKGSLLVPSQGVVQAAELLFMGVEPLGRFDYEKIRAFAAQVLATLSQQRPQISTVAMTLHGAGFGLDEAEAFRAEIAGLLDAIRDHRIPKTLRRISVVEHDASRTNRLREVLETILPGGIAASREPDSAVAPAAMSSLDSVGRDSQGKPLVFVAMPFKTEFDDRFHYGINRAVNAAGFLCERADLAAFTGDVLARVKARIENAALVVADLTTANPNVYLEVGYAWGRGVDTVLIVAEGEEVKFDLRGQRYLKFKSIQNLEELLTKELSALAAQGATGRNAAS